MNSTVIATAQVVGFHAWPTAPAEVSYLADRHRHVFTFKCGVAVSGHDREIEFHILKREVLEALAVGWPRTNGEFDFDNNSCEHLAAWLDCSLRSRCHINASWIEVWEDNENGARLEFR